MNRRTVLSLVALISITMSDWASHLDNVLTMNGEQLLVGPGSVSHEQAVEKAYLDTIKLLESKTKS